MFNCQTVSIMLIRRITSDALKTEWTFLRQMHSALAVKLTVGFVLSVLTLTLKSVCLSVCLNLYTLSFQGNACKVRYGNGDLTIITHCAHRKGFRHGVSALPKAAPRLFRGLASLRCYTVHNLGTARRPSRRRHVHVYVYGMKHLYCTY